ncbi:MAG: InlB B-repeat-containing protein [Bacteroidales bacterium]|nr:InlB B-repeat-containing protein [Bacteroidales bacterium]
MKKFLLTTLCFLIGVLAFAQAPQKMSYQAVIRDNSGNLVANQQISMRISILKESVIGSVEQPSDGRTRAGGGSLAPDQTINAEVYIETHSVTTNANGLASIEIGAGTPTNAAYSFSSIDWSEGTYFIKTDVDLNGGTRFKTIGTSQLISVPYAMYAQKAGSAVAETDPQFNAWDKDYNDLTNRPEIPTVPTNVSAFTNDANYITSADVPAQVNADWNATSGAGQILNKPEFFSGNYNDLTNKPAIPTVPTNVSAFTNDANYITDEIQSLAEVLLINNSASDMQIKNVANPTEDQDVVTKKYVDDIVFQLQSVIDSMNNVINAMHTGVPTSYTIVFDSNGASGTMESISIYPGSLYTIPMSTYNNDDVFICWNTSIDGTGASYYPGQVIAIWSNITLYAQWLENPFTDSRDGNTYLSIRIGDQIWMAENLRYEGNTALGTTMSETEKYRYYSGGYEYYLSTYGYLYNWPAAMNGASSSNANPSDVQGICPDGWHLPSKAEWEQLYAALDDNDRGSQLSSRADLWLSGAMKQSSQFGVSGFNALPAGMRTNSGSGGRSEKACFWSSTESGDSNAYDYYINYSDTNFNNYDNSKSFGCSVRCVRDY